MTQAIILNKIKDAVLLSKNNALLREKGILYFSTNPAIDIYLKENYGIFCQCLSNFVSSYSAANNIKLSYFLSNFIVDRLDDAICEELNEKIGLRGVRFFKTLYSYQAYLQVNVYLNLFTALENVADTLKVNDVSTYDIRLNDFIDCTTTLKKIVDKIYGINTTIISEGNSDKENKVLEFYRNATIGLKRLLKKITVMGFGYSYYKAGMRLREYYESKSKDFREGVPTILLSKPLYDLYFLPQKLSAYNIIYHDMIRIVDSDSPKIRIDFSRFSVNDDEDYAVFKNLILDDIGDDFTKNVDFYSVYLSNLDRLNKKIGIKLGIWGNSPVIGTKSLANEYLIAKGVHVIGSQHGGLLGNRFNDDVILSDLSRCTHYVSYGFNNEDIEVIYPANEFNTQIFPYGTTKKILNGKRDVINILFPITNTMSMLNGGMIREKPDILLNNQKKIINYLDSLKGINIVVKPFQLSSYEDCGMTPLFKKCENVKIINYLTFEETLSHFRVKSVLMESMSTAFYESLGYDLELFVLYDSVRPIEASALEKLKKRAHYFEEVDELIKGIDRYLKGDYLIKRDDSFYKRYVYRKNSEENILKLINDLIV